MRVRVKFLVSFSVAAGLALGNPAARLFAQQQTGSAPMTSAEERAALHSGPDWQLIAVHLPDPNTASSAALETAADVLRARRFPEDALDYYGYAMARGGNVSVLLNKMGVVRLELQQNALAHAMFLRVVRAHKSDAQGWNNLGVTEYVAQNYGAAIADYKKAAKLNKRSAIYRSNLGMVYLETKDLESAHQEFAKAIHLDPAVMQERDGSGSTMHVLGSDKYGELCFEMARLYAASGNREATRLWLGKAIESGVDVRSQIADDQALRPYLKDPQVQLILANAAQLRRRSVASTKAPGLGEAGSSAQTPQNFD